MEWNRVLFVAGALALTAYTCFSAYLAAALIRQGELLPNPLLHPLELAGRFGFIGSCLLLGWLSGLPAAQLGWRPTNWAADVAIGILAAAVLQEANHRGSCWALRRFGRRAYATTVMRAMLPRGRREWALTPFALLPAALAEELLFRGLLIGGLSVYLSPWLLAFFFAAVFGLAHLPQGRLGVVGAGALGLCLSLLFLWRWSVVACTVAHYGVNFVQLVRAPAELAWLEER